MHPAVKAQGSGLKYVLLTRVLSFENASHGRGTAEDANLSAIAKYVQNICLESVCIGK